MHCLVIDDNKMARTALKHLISGVDFLSLAGDCENIAKASEIINQQKVDLLLLDVEMPKTTGLEFLKNSNSHPLVILITAKPEYAVEAFEYNVIDFIVKPVREDRFLKAVHRAKEVFESNTKLFEVNKEFFFIREKGVASKLIINDILYIQALGDYVTIYTAQKRYTIHYTLSAIEKELSSLKFMRIHRSYIVALNKIEKVEEGTAYIYTNPVPIGDTQRSELMRRLNLL